MDKLVSIVLPVYNGEKYLAQSIESVLNQTYKNFELIIVNDCSTDSSEEIILKYKSQDDRIVYIKNEANSKLPKSLNNGFAIAKGEYFTWTSDDNMYHIDAIDTMVGFMEQHTDVGLVYCDFNMINEEGEFKYKVTVGNPEEQKYKNTIGACFLYRRSVAENVGDYDTSLFLVEDYEYWLRISLSYRISPLHMCLYDYRWHNDSLTLTRSTEVEQSVARLHWKYLTEYEKSDMPENELFEYLDFLMKYCNQQSERIRIKLKFSLKHKKYVIRELRKLFSRIKSK
ncbi:glycosyltransferase family 2 protein [Ruminococcus sp. JL13D9]|uniref:glycosyltransferase family 2 protein n=1 Tax=Ruminococcus sp. JL13D9 TaxID=3233381 RepID=UPI00389A93A4